MNLLPVGTQDLLLKKISPIIFFIIYNRHEAAALTKDLSYQFGIISHLEYHCLSCVFKPALRKFYRVNSPLLAFACCTGTWPLGAGLFSLLLLDLSCYSERITGVNFYKEGVFFMFKILCPLNFLWPISPAARVAPPTTTATSTSNRGRAMTHHVALITFFNSQ